MVPTAPCRTPSRLSSAATAAPRSRATLRVSCAEAMPRAVRTIRAALPMTGAAGGRSTHPRLPPSTRRTAMLPPPRVTRPPSRQAATTGVAAPLDVMRTAARHPRRLHPQDRAATCRAASSTAPAVLTFPVATRLRADHRPVAPYRAIIPPPAAASAETTRRLRSRRLRSRPHRLRRHIRRRSRRRLRRRTTADRMNRTMMADTRRRIDPGNTHR